MKEVSYVLRGECMKRFVGGKEKLEDYPVLDGESLQVFEGRWV